VSGKLPAGYYRAIMGGCERWSRGT